MQVSTRSIAQAPDPASYESALRSYFSAIGFSATVAVDNFPAQAFTASLERLAIGELSGAVHCCNTPHGVYATPLSVHESGLDFYFVRSGSIVFRDSNCEVNLQTGDMALMRSDVGFSSHSERMELIALGMPERLARDAALASRWKLGRRIRGDVGFGACLASLLSTATARHDEFTKAEAVVLQSTVVNSILLLSLNDDTDPESPRALSTRQLEKLSQLKAVALQSLQNSELTPEALATQVGVSIRTLHRLFNGAGTTFRTWLRESRLERCWTELIESGLRRRTIASIAFGWGFNDLQTFNRAFSARYGMTPQVARELQRYGLAPSGTCMPTGPSSRPSVATTPDGAYWNSCIASIER